MNFSWPTTGNYSSSDPDSGLLGWQYQINSTSGAWLGTTTSPDSSIGNYIPLGNSTYTLTNSQDQSAISPGTNVVYFRTVDSVGNPSSDSSIRTCNLSFGGAAPQFNSSDQITVTPVSSTVNNYSFSWPEASVSNGLHVTHYYYMVNTPPPQTLTTLQGNPSTYFDIGTSLSIPNRAITNVNKGSNTIYIVAIDDAIPADYSASNYISGTFTLNSQDPDNVNNLSISDSSIKSQSQWNVTLTWTAPNYQGAGNLSYLIYRSSDGTTYSLVGTSTGLSYVDNTPKSSLYYYKVYTRDGANAKSSGTNSVSIVPTGKWTSPPDINGTPSIYGVTTQKATINWSTSRNSDSKIQYGTSSNSYSSVEPSNSDQVTSHSIQLVGLKPSTTYFYRVKWTDEDGNTGNSDEYNFTTTSAPTVKDPKTKNIGLYSAILQYTTTNSSSVKIYYGTTSSFSGSIKLDTSSNESNYTSELTGLLDGTKYYYKINTF